VANLTSIPLEDWSGASATKALHASIEQYQAESSRQTAKMIRLTSVITGLTVILTAGLFIQIWLAFYPPHQ
jgi:hypothetical protein